jgi:hypothetical protein
MYDQGDIIKIKVKYMHIPIAVSGSVSFTAKIQSNFLIYISNAWNLTNFIYTR